MAFAYSGKKDNAEAERMFQAATKASPTFDQAWAA